MQFLHLGRGKVSQGVEVLVCIQWTSSNKGYNKQNFFFTSYNCAYVWCSRVLIKNFPKPFVKLTLTF